MPKASSGVAVHLAALLLSICACACVRLLSPEHARTSDSVLGARDILAMTCSSHFLLKLRGTGRACGFIPDMLQVAEELRRGDLAPGKTTSTI